MSFFDRLNKAIASSQSLLVTPLDPNPEMLPLEFRGGELISDLEQWLSWVVEQTQDRVCAYKPTLGFYTALGAPGLELLHNILNQVPSHIPVILDAKHGDLNTSTVLAQTWFEDWRVDAVTLVAYAGQDQVAPFLLYPHHSVFILCHTSNPAASSLLEYPNSTEPFYLQIVLAAQSWGTPEQIGLEVGSTQAETFARVRATAPERMILARSIWAEGSSDLSAILQAGLDQNGDGLLIPLPNDWLSQADLNHKITQLQSKTNSIREQVRHTNAACQLWTPDICLLNRSSYPHQDLILQLFDLGCILFGEYVQASGATFSYYIDLRKVISNPQVFNRVLDAYAQILTNLTFDRIAGIPYGALPTATGLALRLHRPMIFPRKEVKAHGTRRLIEGHFEPGETAVVVDDILISGKSAAEGAAKLVSSGLVVKDIVVLIDHQGGVQQRLAQHGYQAHSVLTISEITNTLYAAGRITDEQYSSFSTGHSA